ncbi:hypothetical protein D3C85_1839490 [compost metagenome]
MQNRIGGTTHGYVQRHGVFKRLLAGNGARQNGCIVLLVITAGDVNDQMTGLNEQALAVGVRGKCRAVTGQ